MKLTQVQKIIKKWQDEMAGAENADVADIYKGMGIDELNKNLDFSYPREVADRMITGELPMDHQSVWDRRIEQGFGDTMYRGHKHSGNFKDGWYPHSDRDMFMSEDPEVAMTYADAWKARGHVTPLRHNANNLLEVDAEGMGFDDLYLEPYHVPDLDFGTYMGEDHGTEGIGWAVKEEGKRQGVRFKNLIDDYEYDESSPTSTVENILGSRPDVKIRHAELAAHDPQYSGPSIYGAAPLPLALPVIGGLLAAGQSEDADASLASLAKRGLSVVKEPTQVGLDGSLFLVRGADGKEIAHAEMGDDLNGGLSARYMEVEPEYRGSGLMNETYDAIEEMSGKNISPSYWLTEDGAKFWARRNRGLIEQMYNDGEFSWDGDAADVVEGALRAVDGGKVFKHGATSKPKVRRKR